MIHLRPRTRWWERVCVSLRLVHVWPVQYKGSFPRDLLLAERDLLDLEQQIDTQVKRAICAGYASSFQPVETSRV